MQQVCLLLLLQHPGKLLWGGGDFVQYYVANQLVQSGLNPYDRSASEALQVQLGRESGVAMFAPPWSLLPSYPLTSVSVEQAVLANMIVNCLLLTLCVLMWCSVLYPGRYMSWLIMLTATPLWYPNLAVLGMGQLSIWPFLGFTGWLWLTQRGSKIAASLCLVLMVIKPHLGLLPGCLVMGYWLRRRDAVTFGSFLAGLLVVTISTMLIRSSIWLDYLDSFSTGALPVDYQTATLNSWGRGLWGSWFGYVSWGLWLAGFGVSVVLGWRMAGPTTTPKDSLQLQTLKLCEHRPVVVNSIQACCLTVALVPYAFSFDMVMLFPSFILVLGRYLERKRCWQMTLLIMVAMDAWLIAGKQFLWTETVYWPVPWIVTAITCWMLAQHSGVVSSSIQE